MAGDMFLAAFAHIGCDLTPLEALFLEAGLELSIVVHEENRAAGAGCRVEILSPTAQPLRHLSDLTDIVARLSCPDVVKARSVAALTRLAEAEAEAHSCPVERVHFHEVGAVDTLADVVGVFWALDRLGVTHVTASPLPWFSGTVECEHGTIPLPAPATLALMRGLPVFPTEETSELITPTGALVGGFMMRNMAAPGGTFTGPRGEIVACGTGYGSRPAPRGLRLLLLKEQGEDVAGTPENATTREVVIQLEAHLDHLTGEELAHAMECLMETGALDVLWLPGIMKKGRPGGALRVLCRDEALPSVRAAFFRHTHTLGLRESRLERVILPRREGALRVDGEPLAAKAYRVDGVTYLRPEYEDLAAQARRSGGSIVSLRVGKEA